LKKISAACEIQEQFLATKAADSDEVALATEVVERLKADAFPDGEQIHDRLR
jgi:hypothetical protein